MWALGVVGWILVGLGTLMLIWSLIIDPWYRGPHIRQTREHDRFNRCALSLEIIGFVLVIAKMLYLG